MSCAVKPLAAKLQPEMDEMEKTPIQRSTLTQEAYRTLRKAILGRKYPPGTRLVVLELARKFELSPTPVKEALAALEREGLVQKIPHRGYLVPRPDIADASEIYELREVLEGLAGRLATLRGGADLLEKLATLLQQQRQAAERGELETYGDLDLAFHRVLWEASANKRLRQVAENLDGQIRLLISTSAAVPGRLAASLEEHQAILERIEARDPQGAEEAMRKHVRNAWQALEGYLKSSL